MLTFESFATLTRFLYLRGYLHSDIELYLIRKPFRNEKEMFFYFFISGLCSFFRSIIMSTILKMLMLIKNFQHFSENFSPKMFILCVDFSIEKEFHKKIEYWKKKIKFKNVCFFNLRCQRQKQAYESFYSVLPSVIPSVRPK